MDAVTVTLIIMGSIFGLSVCCWIYGDRQQQKAWAEVRRADLEARKRIALSRPQVGDDVVVYQDGARRRGGRAWWGVDQMWQEPDRYIGAGTLIADGTVHMKLGGHRRSDPYTLVVPYTLVLEEQHKIYNAQHDPLDGLRFGNHVLRVGQRMASTGGQK